MKSNIYTDIQQDAVPSLTQNRERGFSRKLYSLHNTVLKKQIVLVIAVIAMLITCIFVPFDAKYLNYFNWATLATLFCTLE